MDDVAVQYLLFPTPVAAASEVEPHTAAAAAAAGGEHYTAAAAAEEEDNYVAAAAAVAAAAFHTAAAAAAAAVRTKHVMCTVSYTKSCNADNNGVEWCE